MPGGILPRSPHLARKEKIMGSDKQFYQNLKLIDALSELVKAKKYTELAIAETDPDDRLQLIAKAGQKSEGARQLLNSIRAEIRENNK